MTTPPNWPRNQGDVGRTLVASVAGIDGLAAISSVEGHVWRPGDDEPATVLAAAVLDAEDCTVTVQLGGVSGWLATAEVGVWCFRLEFVAPNIVWQWPEGIRPATITVSGTRATT